MTEETTPEIQDTTEEPGTVLESEQTSSPEPEDISPVDATGDASPGTPDPAEIAQDTEKSAPLTKARKEAANYRTQLRTLEGRANAMRDQLIELELGAGGVTIAALTAAGVNLDTLLGEDGRVSGQAVQAAAATARETLGIPNNRFGGTADQGGGRGSASPAPAASWGSLLKN